MGIFRQFPYSNFHDMNMDEIIKICRELQDAWAATSAEWANYKDFIDNYFANLDVSEEVLAAIRTLANTGELSVILDPTISAEVASWLNTHITPTSPAIDSSLTISGAGADSATVGKLLLRTFDTYVNDLYNTRDIAVGDYVQTLGYYNVNDGGRSIYVITDTTDDYTLNLNHGLHAKPVFINTVNAGAYGAIGDNDSITKANRAISLAASLNANIVFPADITIGGGLTFEPAFNNKIIKFIGNITYTGSVAAITLHNTKNVVVIGNNIDAENATGIVLLQDGAYTIYNNIISFNHITAGIDGVRLTANTWGIYECNINVNKINCRYYGFHGECLGSVDESRSAFLGQNTLSCKHILSSENYAIRFDATAENTTVTGIYINDISFEGSANGIMLRGDCKMIKIKNIRILEADSFTWIINATGALKFNEFNFTSPVLINKIYITTTQPAQVLPVTITGGIYSPSQFRFADEMKITNLGKFVKSYWNMIKQNGSDFVFNDSYRCFTEFENTSGNTITCDVNGYFNQLGHDTLYVTQNKTDGSIFQIKVGTRVIFDGSAVTDDGVHTYMLKCAYNPSSGSTIYRTIKIS